MPGKNKQRNSKTWIPLVMTSMLALGFMTGLKTGKQFDSPLISMSKNKSKATFKVDEVLGFISQRYVDSIDVNRLAEAAIRMIVDSLDPHSHYMDAESIKAYQARMKGHYEGIGIEFRLLRDTIVVTNVLDDSPASEASFHRGDQILVVNQDTISGKQLPTHSIYKMLKGEKGSEATVLLRTCDDVYDERKIKRNVVRTKSVPVALSFENDLVYVKIDQFNSNTSREFLDILEPHHEAGELKHLIIDLRGNPGGYLQEAVKILNQFFKEKGQVLVYTEGIHSEKTDYKTMGRPYLDPEEVYVLIDEESASASEIIAGALQDLDRGIIVGRRSFGKGLVQEQYDLSHGGSLKLTVARYYTPTGRLIQKQFGAHSDYNDEFTDRAESGEWLTADEIPQPDSTVFYTPSGRPLFGNRGIVPDVFVPIDSSLLTEEALKWYVLKEELAFDLSRHIRCSTGSINDIEQAMSGNDWTTYVATLTSSDNIELLNALPANQSDSFKEDLLALIHRYGEDEQKYFEAELGHDPFIDAVKAHLQNQQVTSQLIKEN